MKKYFTCVLAALFLCACSSAGNLRNSQPTAVYMGGSSVSDVVSCVSDAWSTKHLQISVVDMVYGTSLQLRQNDAGPILALVDIVPVAANTKATYYSRMPDDDTWFFQEVKSCM